MPSYSQRVGAVLAAEHIPPKLFEEMVSRAALTSLGGANRRWHQWMFLIEDGYVEEMFLYMPEMERSYTLWKTCTSCHGEGCKACGWKGDVPWDSRDLPCN